MRKIDYIVLHTAAHGSVADGVDFDTPAVDIHAWHKANGWSGIGYHFVIRKDGRIEQGRPVEKTGAHVKGLNSKSIGICFSGHGDIAPLTGHQIEACAYLVRGLMGQYKVPLENVIGHREAYPILGQKVAKTCPGTKVDMDKLRAVIGGQ